MKPLFTPEELAELAAYDVEIEEEPLTMEEIRAARERDKSALHDAKDRKKQKIAENKRAYYEANREKWNAYQREYKRRKRQEAKKQAAGG